MTKGGNWPDTDSLSRLGRRGRCDHGYGATGNTAEETRLSAMPLRKAIDFTVIPGRAVMTPQ